MEDIGKITYKIKPIKLSEDSDRFEELYFAAEIDGQEASHLVTTKLMDPLYEELNDPYYFQNGKSIPIAYLGGTKPEFRGKNIAGKLLDFANNYHKRHSNSEIYSDTTNSDSGKRVWDKLVEKNKAMELNYIQSKRWRLK